MAGCRIFHRVNLHGGRPPVNSVTKIQAQPLVGSLTLPGLSLKDWDPLLLQQLKEMQQWIPQSLGETRAIIHDILCDSLSFPVDKSRPTKGGKGCG